LTGLNSGNNKTQQLAFRISILYCYCSVQNCLWPLGQKCSSCFQVTHSNLLSEYQLHLLQAGKLKDKAVANDMEAEELPKLKPGHLPVTDWRVFDQRFLGYYTWLEPPLQPKAQKCENCGVQCLKVHRSVHLQSVSYPSCVIDPRPSSAHDTVTHSTASALLLYHSPECFTILGLYHPLFVQIGFLILRRLL
jgi:hypothetical protein